MRPIDFIDMARGGASIFRNPSSPFRRFCPHPHVTCQQQVLLVSSLIQAPEDLCVIISIVFVLKTALFCRIRKLVEFKLPNNVDRYSQLVQLRKGHTGNSQ